MIYASTGSGLKALGEGAVQETRKQKERKRKRREK